MKKKNQIIIVISCLLLISTVLAGCNAREGAAQQTESTAEEQMLQQTEETTAEETVTETVNPPLAEGFVSDPSIELPYGVKISKIDDAGIEVYWKRTEFADGYQVYRSYEKDSGYVLIEDTEDNTNPNNGVYTDNEYDPNYKKIYYRVCSFQYNENNEKIYSELSKPKAAKYREEMEISKKKMFIPSGYERQMEAFYGWGNVQDAVWTSDAPQIAEINEDGVITAVSAGTCNITCRSEQLQTELTAQIVVDRDDIQPLGEIVSRFQPDEDGIWKNDAAQETEDAVIIMVGDLMCTSAQQRVQGKDTGNYNFNESFTYVRDLIMDSDLAVGNLETLLSSSWPYMCEEAYIDNKPNCNAPSRYLDAVRYAGFDCVMTSNNHNCDGGENGVIETKEAVDAYQLANTGIFTSKEDERTLVIDVNGIKVGYLSYSSVSPGFNKKDAYWPQESIDTLLNYIEKDKVEADVARLKERGAEYIIVYMHWGVKNAYGIKDRQREEAQILLDAGVDYITGGHAHLIQPYEELVAPDGKVVPCFFSLGDFHSSINQIPGNRDSVILRIRLKKDENGKVSLVENGYIPCYTYTTYNEMDYVTVPLNPVTNGELPIKNQEKFYNRAMQSVGSGIQEYVPQVD